MPTNGFSIKPLKVLNFLQESRKQPRIVCQYGIPWQNSGVLLVSLGLFEGLFETSGSFFLRRWRRAARPGAAWPALRAAGPRVSAAGAGNGAQPRPVRAAKLNGVPQKKPLVEK